MFKTTRRILNSMKALGITVIVATILATILGIASVRVVDSNETCAVTVLGNVTGEARTGIQLVAPFITSLSCYPSQVNVYQTSENGQGTADYMDFPVEIKTLDGQTAYVEFNIAFSVAHGRAVEIRTNVAPNTDQLVSRVIANYARSVPRSLSPQFTAEQLYGAGRVDYELQISEELSTLFSEAGVTLNSFNLRDINFSEEYETAIENQQIARERIETEGYNADAAVNTARATTALATGEANAEIERARGEAESIRVIAAAEAEAINIRGEALDAYPSILSLEFIESLDTANWMMVPWDDMQGYLPITPQVTP
jgi:regulator of protease activity HflC (stomatin/prohibitin superfamily)